jgi:hypothetical protein
MYSTVNNFFFIFHIYIRINSVRIMEGLPNLYKLQ